MARLHVLSGARSGRQYELPPGLVTIGREPGNTIVIPDESISPQHLMLSLDPEGCRIKDRNTKTGTLLNGQRITSALLQDQDFIKLGSVELRYQAGAPVPRPSANKAPLATPGGLAQRGKARGPRFEDLITGTKAQRKVTVELPLGPIFWWGGLVALVVAGVYSVVRPPPEKPAPNKSGAGTAVSQPAVTAEPAAGGPLSFARNSEPPPLPYPVTRGTAPAVANPTGKILRVSEHGGAQAAVDAAQPGDAVVFDTAAVEIIRVTRKLENLQFIGGRARWEIAADLEHCEFFWHTPVQFTQRSGKIERSAFYRSHSPAAHFTHVDAVSFYYGGDAVSPAGAGPMPAAPQLDFTGFVRGLMIHKLTVAAEGERRWDMHWPPVVRLDATDGEVPGHNSYLLSPLVRNQTAWTPFHVARATGFTFAQAGAEHGVWADPVLAVDYGIDCAIVGTVFGGRGEAASAGYLRQPDRLRYHDREEWGHAHTNAPFRGAAIQLGGQRNRIIGHGGLSVWSVGRRAALPGLHYLDGIVARDPFLQEWSAEIGGVSANFAEPKNFFRINWHRDGTQFTTTSSDQRLRYPLTGPNLSQPVLVPLADLRAPPPEFMGKPFRTLTGQPGEVIQQALDRDENVFLGAGDYELTRPITNGFVFGAGMEQTVLRWPDGVDAAQRACRGLMNLTVRGGRHGYNSQAGEGGALASATAQFLRVRFDAQAEAGINVHAAQDQSYQDCEFVNGRIGFTQGNDRSRGVYTGERGPAGGLTILRLNIANCRFRNLSGRGIDLRPLSEQGGAVGIHNCVFEDIGESAVRIFGGQSHLVQNCEFRRVGKAGSTNAVVEISGHGAVLLSHLELNNQDFPGAPAGILVQGRASVSHVTFKGVGRALVSRSQVLADHCSSPEGVFDLAYGSLVTLSQFKNGDVRKGAMFVREGNRPESVSLASGIQPLDATPPPPVTNVTVTAESDGVLIQWKAVADPESGILGYLVFAGDRLIGRTPPAIDPPDNAPALTRAPLVATMFLDVAGRGTNYVVKAVNGANLISGGGEGPAPRWGPAEGRFLDKSAVDVVIREIVFKNRAVSVTDAGGRTLGPGELSRLSMPESSWLRLETNAPPAR